VRQRSVIPTRKSGRPRYIVIRQGLQYGDADSWEICMSGFEQMFISFDITIYALICFRSIRSIIHPQHNRHNVWMMRIDVSCEASIHVSSYTSSCLVVANAGSMVVNPH
jgi:hypothetical protein